MTSTVATVICNDILRNVLDKIGMSVNKIKTVSRSLWPLIGFRLD